jgi:transposase-like protein/IS1 family transposase
MHDHNSNTASMNFLRCLENRLRGVVSTKKCRKSSLYCGFFSSNSSAYSVRPRTYGSSSLSLRSIGPALCAQWLRISLRFSNARYVLGPINPNQNKAFNLGLKFPSGAFRFTAKSFISCSDAPRICMSARKYLSIASLTNSAATKAHPRSVSPVSALIIAIPLCPRDSSRSFLVLRSFTILELRAWRSAAVALYACVLGVQIAARPTVYLSRRLAARTSVSRAHVEVLPAAAFSIKLNSASVMRISKRAVCRSSSDLGGLPLGFFSMFLLYGKIFSAQPLQCLFIYRTINRDEQGNTQQLLVVIVVTCQHESKKRHGKDRKGNQRFRCLLCGKTFVEETTKPLGEMRINMKEATTALGLLLEGMSVRATSRLTGLHGGTICDLILHVGENCRQLLDAKVVGVPVADVQLDEIWSFVGMKERTRVAQARSSEWGDCWTFIAIERDTKLVLAHTIGQRDMATSTRFLKQLDRATSGRFQLSSDGLRSYTLNVPFVLGNRVDFAQLIKNYASTPNTVRYSPAKITGIEKIPQLGEPDEWRICTSHVERLNLTIRMNLRRFTRLTNGHSKSLKHHVAMQAILFAWHNFVRVHSAIKKTPAMASALSQLDFRVQ